MSQLVIRTSEPPAIAENLRPSSVWRVLTRRSGLIAQFASRDILERHRGAYLGILWNLAQPLITLAIYTFVFGFVFKSSWDEAANVPQAAAGQHVVTRSAGIIGFVLPFFVGHAIFHFFAESTNRAPFTVAGRPNLVKKVMFPVEILPVVSVIAATVYPIVALSALVIAEIIFTGGLPWTVVLFPLCIAPLVPLCLGISWLLAGMGAYIRDVRQITGVCTHLLMFLSPVFYSIDRIPEAWHGVYRLNPLVTIIESSRSVMLWGEQPNWLRLGVVMVGSLIVMQVGFAAFMRMRRGLGDVV